MNSAAVVASEYSCSSCRAISTVARAQRCARRSPTCVSAGDFLACTGSWRAAAARGPASVTRSTFARPHRLFTFVAHHLVVARVAGVRLTAQTGSRACAGVRLRARRKRKQIILTLLSIFGSDNQAAHRNRQRRVSTRSFLTALCAPFVFKLAALYQGTARCRAQGHGA